MMPSDVGPLAKHWWMIAARGVLALMLGAAIVLWRFPAPDAIVVPFGVYAVVDGVLAIASSLRTARPRMTGWPILLEGLAVLGSLLLGWFSVPRPMFVLLAAWGLLTGCFEIVAAVCVPWEADAHWFLMGGGASSVLLAVIVLGVRDGGSDRIALILGVYASVFGAVMLAAALAFRWGGQLGTVVSSLGLRRGRHVRA